MSKKNKNTHPSVPREPSQTRMIPTREDWHPAIHINAQGQEVFSYLPEAEHCRTFFCLAFHQLGEGLWRVCAWGGDDFGLEKDFADREKALKLYESIQPWTTVKTLIGRYGFKHA